MFSRYQNPWNHLKEIGNNMPIVGFKCTRKKENVSFDDCLKCSLTYENKCQFTPDILNGIISQVTDVRDAISVTKIIGCQRLTYLMSNNDVYVSPEKLYWAFRGTLAHSIIEKYKIDPDAIVEQRFNKTIAGKYVISGKPDIIIPKHKIIRDYKTTNSVPMYNRVYSHHEEQLNIYRWLVYDIYPIDRLEVVYMDMKQVKTCEVKNIWELSLCEEVVTKRVTALAEALATKTIPDPPSEFPIYWQCKDYCDCNGVCVKLFKENLTKDFDKWASKEWFEVEKKGGFTNATKPGKVSRKK